jgi:ribosomal protein S18 acetylase RimI-like enzyme
MGRDDLEKRALDTDLRLLEPICEFIRREDHFVYRSSLFPTFYGGNGIELLDPLTRDLSQWEELFHSEFPRDRFKHETFTLRLDAESEPLLEAARAAGYHVDNEQYMGLTSLPEPKRPDRDSGAELSILGVRGDADWQRMEAFHRLTSTGKDWFQPVVESDPLIAKSRHVSEAIDLEWYLLVSEDQPMPLARAGIFFHLGIGRLQDVETHPEHLRRGHATRLLRFMLERAFEEVEVDAVCLCADEEPPALALYESLGFTPLGRHVTLMRYPSSNRVRQNAHGGMAPTPPP